MEANRLERLVAAGHVEVCLSEFGDEDDPAVLLIGGAAMSMDWWDERFCARLAAGGRRVVRYDHRDTGGSAHYPAGAPPYGFDDLVGDAVGVLDALGLERAHLVGISMGGEIAQVIALEHPDRVETLTVIASAPASPSGGGPATEMSAELAAFFATERPDPDWSEITVPTLVVHGARDPLFPLAGARALAAAVPGAELLELADVGHEVPPAATWDVLVPALLRHTSGGWRHAADRLAARAVTGGDVTGWFEPLYRSGAAGELPLPWERDEVHPLLAEWATGQSLVGHGRRAVVVGCGLGADAEYLARLGFATSAFDVAPSAVRLARERHPRTAVRYFVANLLRMPGAFNGAFDLVVDVFTVQALPPQARREAQAAIGRLVAPGGRLLVVASAGDTDGGVGGGAVGVLGGPPPWPLSRADVEAFAGDSLKTATLDALPGPLWRAEFTRPR